MDREPRHTEPPGPEGLPPYEGPTDEDLERLAETPPIEPLSADQDLSHHLPERVSQRDAMMRALVEGLPPEDNDVGMELLPTADREAPRGPDRADADERSS